MFHKIKYNGYTSPKEKGKNQHGFPYQFYCKMIKAERRNNHNEGDEASSPLYPYSRYKAWHKKSPPDVSDIKNDNVDRIPLSGQYRIFFQDVDR